MGEFKDRLPKNAYFGDATIASGEALMPAIRRKQYEKALRGAEARAAKLRQKAALTEGKLSKSRLEEAADQAEVAAREMKRKIAELDSGAQRPPST